MHLSPLLSLSLLLPTLASALPSSQPLTASLQDYDQASSSSSSPSNDLYRYANKVYLLRHGEKGSDGETGLNSKGKKRAKCLKKLLSKPRFKIGLILAEEYDHKTHKRKRPYDTVKPIADKLGLKVDTSCEVDDAKCVRRRIERYARKGGKGNVVICWKHSMLHKIAHELGAKKTTKYPDDRYDIMWTLHHNRLIEKESEHCPGLDPKKSGKHDPDLEIHPDSDMDEAEEEDDEEDLDEEEDELELDWLFGQGMDQVRLADLD